MTNLIFEGACWKFGHNIPTDLITPTRITLSSIAEMAKHVLETADPEFPKRVQPGDILVAGRNFGCSSGRAIAPKALKATGLSVIVAELFARTFYRNGYEIGLPLVEAPGIHELVESGDRVRVDVANGVVEDLTSGKSIQGMPPSEFLLEMLQAGGLIPLLKAGSRFFPGADVRP
ncbi:MAG: 3-isopropylmalate dehydratase [Acidobacteriia bacterium]|nr:3-isopropylmalate dehydratase [Terriglobia bacterium]